MIAGIIQARMGSSRLPGKVMMEACGKPLLELMIERVKRAKTLDKVIIATSVEKQDDEIVKFCKKHNIEYFRGSEHDLLSRYKFTAESINANIIVRLVSDTPLIDPKEIDKVVETYVNNSYDFVSNFFPFPRTYPDGFSVEVFSFKILVEMFNEAKRPSDREHMTFFIWRQPQRYKIFRVDYNRDISNYRFNLDYKEDYLLIKAVYEGIYQQKREFTLEDIINFLDSNSYIFELNSKIKPYENIIKSFQEDKELGFIDYDDQFTKF